MDIDPKELSVVKTQVTKANSAAVALKVTTDEEMLEAGELLKKIKTVAKMVKTRKEEITKPINEGLKSIRSMFAPLEDNIEATQSMVSDKMLDYQRAQDEKRRKAEKEANDKLIQAQKDLEAGKITEKQAEKIEAKVETKLDKAPEAIKKSESFHTRKVKKFRVVNETAIPREYFMLNEIAVRHAMNQGIVIAGVEYYEESIIV